MNHKYINYLTPSRLSSGILFNPTRSRDSSLVFATIHKVKKTELRHDIYLLCLFHCNQKYDSSEIPNIIKWNL
jgi:hypothetical protein